MLGFLVLTDENLVLTLFEALERMFLEGEAPPLQRTFNSFSEGTSPDVEHATTPGSMALPGELAALETSCLESWALLLTVLAPGVSRDKLRHTHLSRLLPLLDKADVDLRVGAAEAIALLLERAFGEMHADATEANANEDALTPFQMLVQEEGEDFVAPALSTLRQLANESTKHKSKRDKQTQRRTCRAVVTYFEQEHVEPIEIRLSPGETLRLDTWATQRQYSFLKQLLGSGVYAHLRLNDSVRHIFQLGAARVAEVPPPVLMPATHPLVADGEEADGGPRRRRRVVKGNVNKGEKGDRRQASAGVAQQLSTSTRMTEDASGTPQTMDALVTPTGGGSRTHQTAEPLEG